MSLVDAIPDIPKRGIERGRNWDEVVLPTVAKQLGLDREESEEPEPVPEEIVPPAPGTFDYDYSKYKGPSVMDMTTPTPSRPMSPQSADGHLIAPEKSSRRTSMASKPPVQVAPVEVPRRLPSPAPFSDYSPLSEAPVRSEPRLQKSTTAQERGRDMRNSKPPKIKITPPGEFAMDVAEPDDEKHSKGCKCVIM